MTTGSEDWNNYDAIDNIAVLVPNENQRTCIEKIVIQLGEMYRR